MWHSISIITLGTLCIGDAQAKEFIYRNPFGVMPLRFERISKNLLKHNGKLYELDRSGRIRPLYLHKRSGKLHNFKEPSTSQQVMKFYQGEYFRFRPKELKLVSRFFSSIGAGLPQRREKGLSHSEKKNAIHSKSSNLSQNQGVSRPIATGVRSAVPLEACRNPTQAICKWDKGSRNELTRTEDFKNQIVKNYVRSNRTSLGVLRQIAGNPFEFQTGVMSYFQFLGSKIKGLSSVVSSVKAAMLSSLAQKPVSAEAFEAISRKIQRAKVGVLPNFTDRASILAFFENCGPFGMSDGAFAVPPLGEVILCPGLVLGALAKGGSLQSHLSHVLAHEIGHHFGADINPNTNERGPFSSLYRRYNQCLKRRFKTVREGKIGEAVADLWGVSALSSQVAGMSRSQAFSFIKNAAQPLCGSADDGVHPSGAFRINILLGRNRDIRKALGCSAPNAERPECHMGGEN